MYNLNELRELSFAELYKLYIIPRISRLALEKKEIRTMLLQRGGRDWAEQRIKEFANGDRQVTTDCSVPERELRTLETKIFLQLAYPTDLNAGILSICEREPALAAATSPPLKTFMQSST
mmetsp:Transcript_7307/g.10203  ORF Transcript_7307/g.10203 Transcript_7307/m.10203 type:complete len:120 (-) Transcript_7307:248-607(-)